MNNYDENNAVEIKDTRKEEVCWICKSNELRGMHFCNKHDFKPFINMPKGEQAHAECYIEHCVKLSIERFMDDGAYWPFAQDGMYNK